MLKITTEAQIEAEVKRRTAELEEKLKQERMFLHSAEWECAMLYNSVKRRDELIKLLKREIDPVTYYKCCKMTWPEWFIADAVDKWENGIFN